MPPSQTPSLLRDGITAAQAGNKVRARFVIRQVVGLEPENEIAWLWLANVAADPVEALSCLRTVLKLNPDNHHAKTGLTTAVVRTAIDAAHRKDFPTARQLLREALDIDPDNEHALLWMAGVSTYPSDSIRYLRRVLEINPNNERAKQGLAQYPVQAAWTCPLCESPGREPVPRCSHCNAVVVLDSPTAFDTPTGADETLMGRAIARLSPRAQSAPGSADAFCLGLAYLNIGRPAEAIKIFNAAATRADADANWKAQVHKLAAHWRTAPAHRPTKPDAPEGPPLVLVVDDSATVRKLVTVALQGADYRVVSLADGLQVAEALQTHGVPALAILDIIMPGMDGFQVCTLLRENPATAKVPVIFLTGKDGFFNKLRGKWAGAAEYLTKPFQPKALVEVVGKVLAAKK
ncbi:response regulator [Limnoglobus roseus]|uniref:Tetratricopeptide repeat protein n=1 Tax=Limnoglobus roseus TaxID=2598579 RepID=A0A5C1A9K2_9BACT|nr:response regulator [Limnoglobus roseus]QEL15400.1 tetratricopeptide repeat protein [Limnoglobus roseus]